MSSLKQNLTDLYAKLRGGVRYVPGGNMFKDTIEPEVYVAIQEFSNYWHGLTDKERTAYTEQLKGIDLLLSSLHIPADPDGEIRKFSPADSLTFGRMNINSMLSKHGNNELFCADEPENVVYGASSRSLK